MILKAMKDALESLIQCKKDNEHRLQTEGITVVVGSHYAEEPIKNLRDAIAEMEKEKPVAYKWTNNKGWEMFASIPHNEYTSTPLYTAPVIQGVGNES